MSLFQLQSELLTLLDFQSHHSLAQNALESSHGAGRTACLNPGTQKKKVQPEKKKVSLIVVWAPEGTHLVISGELR